MSLLHLKTRKEAKKDAAKAKKAKRYAWKIDGHLVEVLRPKEPPGCCETSIIGGIFYDGKEVLPPGRLGARVGFIIDKHHYQFRHNAHAFANPRGRKGGKFIFIVDGWEVDTRMPVNQFFYRFNKRILIFGMLQWIGAAIGLLTFILDGSIWTSLLLRGFLIFFPLGLYYTYVGVMGVIKYAMRLHLDDAADPWWEPEVFEDANEGDHAGNAEAGNAPPFQPLEPIVDQPGAEKELTADDWARIIAQEDAANARAAIVNGGGDDDDALISMA